MDRRQYITTIASTLTTASLAGCSSGSSQNVSNSSERRSGTAEPDQPSIETKLSESQRDALVEFHTELQDLDLSKLKMYTDKTGEKVFVEYMGDEHPRSAFEQIALAYARALETQDGLGRLTVIGSGIKAYVPRSTARSYADGDLKEDAFLETIEIKNIEGNEEK